MIVIVHLVTVTADSGGASHSSVPVHLRQQKKLKTKAKPFIEPTGVHVRINHVSAELCHSLYEYCISLDNCSYAY